MSDTPSYDTTSSGTAFSDTARIFTVTTPNATMRVAQDGQGPDIVWIPGGDAPAEYWLEQWQHFTSDFRCTSYDPRGVGETVSVPPPWTIDDLADDCAALIRACCDAPVAVIGLSMGGLITQALAIRHPDLVRIAIPMGTAAWIGGFTRDWMQAEIDFRKAGHKMPVDFATCHYAAFAYPARALADPVVWDKVKTAYGPRFGDRDPDDLIAQWQACLDFDCRADLGRCQVPIHAIGFTEDVQTPPSMVREVADLAANGTYHEIDGLGHVSFTRHAPDVVAARLREILSSP